MGLQVGGMQACMLREARQHARANLLTIVKCKDCVGPPLSGQHFMRPRLTFDHPADPEQRRQNPTSFHGWPIIHF